MAGFQFSRSGNGPVGMTNLSSTLIGQSGSVQVKLNNPSNQIQLSNYSEFPLFVNFSGPATPNNYAVPPKQTMWYDGPAVTAIQLNSNGQVVNYGILAL